MKRLSYLLLLVLFMQGAASCALFRKKNRCDSCPKWSRKAPANKIDSTITICAIPNN